MIILAEAKDIDTHVGHNEKRLLYGKDEIMAVLEFHIEESIEMMIEMLYECKKKLREIKKDNRSEDE